MIDIELPETRFVNRDGVKVAYWVWGEGTPLLLITGLGTPASTWHVFPQLLADQGYQVIVLDNRDCGSSGRCEEMEYTIADMADDAVAVLDALSIHSTYVFGISMGGMIAQEIALNHPDRVRKLMLVATTPGQPAHVSASAEVLTDMFSGPPTGDIVDGTARMLGKLMGPKFVEKNQELLREIAERRVRDGSDSGAFLRQWNAIMAFAASDRLDQIRVPTLVLHGEVDPLVPFENGNILASNIPGARLIALPEVGHFIPLEDPRKTISSILQFLPAEEKVEA